MKRNFLLSKGNGVQNKTAMARIASQGVRVKSRAKALLLFDKHRPNYHQELLCFGAKQV